MTRSMVDSVTGLWRRKSAIQTQMKPRVFAFMFNDNKMQISVNNKIRKFSYFIPNLVLARLQG